MFRISISMARVSPVVLALGATVLTGGGATAQAEDQERQSQLMTAADLGSGDPDRIRLALVKMSRMPVEEWSPELRETLFDALVREIGEETYGDDPHVAIYPMFNMVMQIAESGDVRAAPILVRHGGFGWDQLDLIVSFGEPGLRALLEFAPELWPYDDTEHLDHQRLLAVLHLFVYEWGGGGLRRRDSGPDPRHRRTVTRRAGVSRDPYRRTLPLRGGTDAGVVRGRQNSKGIRRHVRAAGSIYCIARRSKEAETTCVRVPSRRKPSGVANNRAWLMFAVSDIAIRPETAPVGVGWRARPRRGGPSDSQADPPGNRSPETLPAGRA